MGSNVDLGIQGIPNRNIDLKKKKDNPNLVAKSAGVALSIYAPKMTSAVTYFQQGDFLNGTIKAGEGAKNMPWTVQYVQQTWQAIKSIQQNLAGSNGESAEAAKKLLNSGLTSPEYTKFWESAAKNVQIEDWHYFPKPIKDSLMSSKQAQHFENALNNLDESLLHTEAGQKFVRLFDKTAKIDFIDEGTFIKLGDGAKSATAQAAGLTASQTSATFVAKTLGHISKLGVAISMCLELPSVVNAFRKGGCDEGVRQTARSSLNVVSSTVCAAAIGVALAPFGLGPLGLLVGTAIGSYIGYSIADRCGKKIIGEPMPDQNRTQKGMQNKNNAFASF